MTSRVGSGWRRQEVTTPEPGRQTAARRKWGWSPVNAGINFPTLVLNWSWEEQLSAQSLSATGSEKPLHIR